jgi:translation elongation factor EF-4
MINIRKYGSAPYRVAVVHGGPGAPGSVAAVARELAKGCGILEPLQTATTVAGQVDELRAGEVGYVAASMKDVRDTRVGDTITDAENPADTPLSGYRPAVPMVFCGIYPADTTGQTERQIQHHV